MWRPQVLSLCHKKRGVCVCMCVCPLCEWKESWWPEAAGARLTHWVSWCQTGCTVQSSAQAPQGLWCDPLQGPSPRSPELFCKGSCHACGGLAPGDWAWPEVIKEGFPEDTVACWQVRLQVSAGHGRGRLAEGLRWPQSLGGPWRTRHLEPAHTCAHAYRCTTWK